MEEFIAHPDVHPLPGFGRCQVVACDRDRCSPSHGHCHMHRVKWTKRSCKGPADLDHFNRTEPPTAEEGSASLRGLAPLVIAQFLYGLQQRAAQGTKTKYWSIRQLADVLRRHEVGSLTQPLDIKTHSIATNLLTRLQDACFLALRSPETEALKDTWDLRVFGHGGTLDFTAISQSWLREAAKRWASDRLPTSRNKQVYGNLQTQLKAVALLSESLRAHRADSGQAPAALSRADIEHHLHRLVWLEEQEEISAYGRYTAVHVLKFVLTRMRTLGLGRPGGPLENLPDDVALTRRDVPELTRDKEIGRNLPPEVLRALCDALPLLDDMETAPGVRVAVELLIDTGRRPDEICQLPWDCLERDPDGKHVLIYNNSKSNREQRRLPIADATAAVIVRQQQTVRARFPHAELSTLKLLPSRVRNPHGTRGIASATVGATHRKWVDALPPFMVTTAVATGGRAVPETVEFDKKRIFPYAYRHSYAQRNADAGVPIDVLRELMDHESFETTRWYYRKPRELHQTGEHPQVARSGRRLRRLCEAWILAA
ncbi:tyrosine-type recombinase/integrase [Actinoallomurus liliacearum]|uniref:tyrosine-type recombinase/integrase n=1 Tax=Actinoallomurus liliacearum TaxID=1080073 RepID=UPI0031EA3B83